MKRIDAMIQNMKRSVVIEAIIKAGVGGVTVAETRGKGAGERPVVGGARGTTKYVADYNRTDTITTIVDDSKVDAVVKAIMDAARTGEQGDGKVFVSTVDESYDIATGQKGKL